MKRSIVNLVRTHDVTPLGDISQDELLRDAKKYDKEKYDPLSNLDEKEVVPSGNRTEVITIRLNRIEYDLIRTISDKQGISKSTLVRSLVVKYLKQAEKKKNVELCSESHPMFETERFTMEQRHDRGKDSDGLQQSLAELHKDLYARVLGRAKRNGVSFEREVLHLLSLGLGRTMEDSKDPQS